MAWTELKPGKPGVEYVRVSRMSKGTLLVSISAPVVSRNKIGAETRFRMLANLDAAPRLLRLVVDREGPFKARLTKGGAVIVSIGKLSGLAHIAFEKCDVEWDELVDERKHAVIELELPKPLQVQMRAASSLVPSVAVAANGVRR